MITEALARELHDAGLVDYRADAIGGTAFLEDMPNQPELAVALYSRGGPPADAKLGYDMPAVQIVVRAADVRTATAKLATIYAALHGLHDRALPDGTWVVSCLGDQSSPVRIGPDQQGRPQVGINFTLEIRSLTTHRE